MVQVFVIRDEWVDVAQDGVLGRSYFLINQVLQMVTICWLGIIATQPIEVLEVEITAALFLQLLPLLFGVHARERVKNLHCVIAFLVVSLLLLEQIHWIKDLHHFFVEPPG